MSKIALEKDKNIQIHIKKQSMMAYFISLGIFFMMLALTIQKKDKQAMILTILLLLSIIITFVGIPEVITISMLIYTLGALFIVLYGITSKKLNQVEKVLVALSGLGTLVAQLFALMHWPYYGEVKLMQTLPLVLYFLLLAKDFIRNKVVFLLNM